MTRTKSIPMCGVGMAPGCHRRQYFVAFTDDATHLPSAAKATHCWPTVLPVQGAHRATVLPSMSCAPTEEESTRAERSISTSGRSLGWARRLACSTHRTQPLSSTGSPSAWIGPSSVSEAEVKDHVVNTGSFRTPCGISGGLSLVLQGV